MNNKSRLTARTLAATAAFLVFVAPATAAAQVDEPILPPIPCPWWQCDGPSEVVVEEYRVEVVIEDKVATTRVTQILRNDGRGLAEGEFLHPIPADAAVTGLTLWIDGEPVSGELLDGDAARKTYEEIVRRTLDPALLEFVDDDLLRLSVFPIPEGAERKVEIEYRQILAADGGLVRYRHSLAREHANVEVERVVTRIELIDRDGLKTIHSPTHSVGVDRISETEATVGFEGFGAPDGDFALYYSTDAEPVSLDVISYRDGREGWFLLLASPGLAADEDIIPKDVVLVLDVSGSMEGEKLDQAREAARFVLDSLNPEDRFEILSFSTGITAYGGGLRPESEASDARRWVGGLAAGGSTNIHRALTEAFALADRERPLYVTFLTDGLPTEGVIDTAEILGSLDARGSETISVFAFGVGFDVDTVLLDSIARDHHGTTQYVVPGEDIDDAVSSLYAKISSPVLTGVVLEVDGVQVWDIHPDPLPDIFSGEQLVVAGRYEDWGPATVTLSGRLRGEPVAIEYDDVRFVAAGGDDAVPGLWATRKIGALLRQIRIDGPDPETIEQIVKISIRHGIVTPYTSYLVTEPAPFGEEAIEDIARSAAASTTTFAASGEAAVGAADLASELADSDVAAPTSEYEGLVRSAAGRTLRHVDGVWVDTTYDPSMDLIRVAFGSDDYFRLAASSDTAADLMAVGTRVILVIDEVAYEVVGEDSAADDLPDTVTTEATTTTSTLQPIALGSGPPDTSNSTGWSAEAIALVAALGAAAALSVVAARRTRREK